MLILPLALTVFKLLMHSPGLLQALRESLWNVDKHHGAGQLSLSSLVASSAEQRAWQSEALESTGWVDAH